MNNFLNDMQSLTLYNQITKINKAKKPKNILDESVDDIQLEMVKYKSAVASKGMATKIETSTFSDYSSISEIGTTSVNAMTSVKDNITQGGGLSSTGGGANSKAASGGGGGISGGGSGSSLGGYSARVGGGISGGIASITQFGMIKMTGTEGGLQNGYTIGKDASPRASASLEYITREENGKEIAEIKDKDGNRISKLEAKEQIKDIQAERRLVLSANPRLNLNDEQLDKIVRTTMSSYSESFGKEFEYFYAIHNNTKTPHAHILMTSTHPDGDGIKMYKDELFEMKMNFEDAVKEEVENSNIKIKDNTTLPLAKQIGNFIGAVPDTNMFNQNKYLAYKISKKFELDYDQKDVGNDPQKLEQWFDKNQSSYKEYFMSATNKEAFLFQEYSKSAIELNDKYDLGLNEKTTTDIKEFKSWVDDKKEVFLAERIAQDKHIILQKDDVQDSKQLYKWFKENETEVKEWNNQFKQYPSKQMSSLASKYGDMVDNKPDDLMTDRKVAREFVKNYTREPLAYAGDSRKSLHKILETKQEQFKNEFKESRITEKSFDSETKRLDSLQNRLIQGQEVSEGSLKRYNLDTKVFSTNSKIIELDGIDLKDDIKKDLTSKIEEHKENLDKNLENKSIDEEYHKTYSKKANTLNYIVSKSQNISVSALENAGLDKQTDLSEFKIEKVKTELRIINFKDTDVQKDYIDILKDENENKQKPLNHQMQKITNIGFKSGIQADIFSLSNYKDANKWIDEHKDLSSKKELEQNLPKDIKTNFIEEITSNNYIKAFEEFSQKIETNEIDISTYDSKNTDTFYTIMEQSIINKDIETMDKLYQLDPGASDGKELLDIKFKSYADVLEISRDDVYGKMLEKHFDFSSEDIEKLDDPKKVFDTNIEFSQIGKDNEFINLEDIKIQLYIETLTELVTQKYEEFQWDQFDMNNEDVSEENMKAYFDAIQSLNDDAVDLNEFVSKDIELKALENEIEQNLSRGNFNHANELMNDEGLDEFTKNTLEHIYKDMLNDEHILDELHERILDNVELDEKVYEIFKEEDFLNDMKKIDLQENQMEELQNEIEEEIRLEEIEEQELELGL